MAIVIELKRSSVPGKVPATTELALGELAINTYDGKLYLKKNVSGAETVVDITSGGGGSGSGTVTSVGTAGSVNGITLTGGPITSTGTITLGGTLSNILNNQLANSSLTIGSTNISLGGTVSTLTGLSSVTATNFIGNIIGSITSASYAGTSSRVDTSFINTNTDYYVTFVEGTSDGNKSLYSDTSISYNPSTNLLSTSRIYAVQITGSLFGTASFASTASFLLGSVTSASYAGTSSRSILTKVPGAGQYPIIFAGSSGEGTGSQELYVTGSDFSYEPQTNTLNIKNLNGTASFALNAGGGSSINTGSFATTGSNTFIGNQIITGSLTLSSSAATELTVIGNSIFSGSLDINSNPSGTYGPFIINSRPNLSNSSVISLINSYSGNNYYSTGSSIDFWGFQSDEYPFINGIYKNSFIQDLNYSLNFGSIGSFKWNIFNTAYTGSSTGRDGSGFSTGNPIGNTILTLNDTNLSSSVAVVAPSVTAPSLIGTASLATLATTATTATTATVATTITAASNTTDAIRYLVYVPTGAGNRNPQINVNRLVANAASGSLGLGKSTIATGFHLDVSGSVLISGSLVVTSSANTSTLGQFTGNNNGFVEFSVRNSNNGVSASSDIAVYNNSGSATINHINMGINSSGIASGFSFGRGNDSYVYNTGGDLFIGNNTAFNQPAIQSQSLHLFANSAGTPNLTITGSRVGIQKSGSLNATLDVSGSVIITGSVQGNVSALTISSNTASINLNLGNFFTLTLSGTTHLTATNIKPGQTVNVLLTTDTYNNSVTFNSTIFKQPSGLAYTPTQASDAKDILTFVSYDTTNLYVVSVKNLI